MSSRLIPFFLSFLWLVYVATALTLEYRHTFRVSDPTWTGQHRVEICSVWLYLLLFPTVFFFWKMRKRFWKEALLLLFSILVALLLGQVLIALVYPELNAPSLAAIRERKYHHIYPPNTLFHEKFSDDIEMDFQTNSDGLRTPYEPETFRDHEVRIAVLGDSFTFGVGVGENETFSAVLESKLKEELGLDAAVLNCGIVSYSPFLESILYRGAIQKYRPNYTLLFLDATDFSDDVRYQKEATVENGEIVFEFRGNKQFQYWGFVIESFLKPVLLRPLLFPIQRLLEGTGLLEPADEYDFYATEVVIDGKPDHNRFFIYYYPLERIRPYLEQTYRHIERVYRQARRIGSEFALVVTPRYHHWNRKECPHNWESHQYTGIEPYQYEYFRFFDEKKERAPFPIFDLLPAFRETERFPLVFDNDPHWNAAGHRFVAERTFEFLKKEFFRSR